MRTYFLTLWPTYAINLNRLTIIVGDHTGIIPFEYGQIPISGLAEVVWSFPYIIQCKILTQGAGSMLTPGA